MPGWISEADHARVSAAIEAAEARTAGEIVTVVADRSDGYSDVALAWAAIAAFTALVVLALLPDFYLWLADSLLGATVQASYYCAPCARRTEGRLHQCGRAAQHAGGFAWFDNDFVNLSATALGAGLGALWLWIAAF